MASCKTDFKLKLFS